MRRGLRALVRLIEAAIVRLAEPEDYPCYSFSDGPCYRVTRYPNGHWTCSCPDHMYRQRDCKHIRVKRAERAYINGGRLDA